MIQTPINLCIQIGQKIGRLLPVAVIIAEKCRRCLRGSLPGDSDICIARKTRVLTGCRHWRLIKYGPTGSEGSRLTPDITSGAGVPNWAHAQKDRGTVTMRSVPHM